MLNWLKETFIPDKTLNSSITLRISDELSFGERLAVDARKAVAAEALGQLLGEKVSNYEVPVVAVLGSGGGIRAMLSLLGSMEGLQETGLLKYVTYICGVSGSTWAMSQLYENVNWSTKLPTKDISDKLVGEDCPRECVIKWIVEEKPLWERMVKAASKEVFSVTDIWAATVSYLIGTENTSTLSNHQEYVYKGQNPYPVYAAIDKDTFDSEKEPHPPETWFEFTPHECGFSCHGIFVETSDFGSKFENGVKKEHHSEPDMCQLQGLWGSAMGDEKYLRNYLKAALKKLFWKYWDALWNPLYKCYAALKKRLYKCYGKKTERRFASSQAFSFSFHQTVELLQSVSSNIILDDLKFVYKTFKALCHWKFGTTFNYLYKYPLNIKDKNIKNIHNVIKKKYLSLVDAGLAINCAYPLMLQDKRKVDVIISLDYSVGDVFMTLNQAKTYADAYNLPFPPVDKKGQKPQDYNVYSDDSTPTVIHMPLFNDSNKYESTISDYGTYKMKYSQDEIVKLLKIAKENITRNKDKILEEIKKKMHSK